MKQQKEQQKQQKEKQQQLRLLAQAGAMGGGHASVNSEDHGRCGVAGCVLARLAGCASCSVHLSVLGSVVDSVVAVQRVEAVVDAAAAADAAADDDVVEQPPLKEEEQREEQEQQQQQQQQPTAVEDADSEQAKPKQLERRYSLTVTTTPEKPSSSSDGDGDDDDKDGDENKLQKQQSFSIHQLSPEGVSTPLVQSASPCESSDDEEDEMLAAVRKRREAQQQSLLSVMQGVSGGAGKRNSSSDGNKRRRRGHKRAQSGGAFAFTKKNDTLKKTLKKGVIDDGLAAVLGHIQHQHQKQTQENDDSVAADDNNTGGDDDEKKNKKHSNSASISMAAPSIGVQLPIGLPMNDTSSVAPSSATAAAAAPGGKYDALAEGRKLQRVEQMVMNLPSELRIVVPNRRLLKEGQMFKQTTKSFINRIKLRCVFLFTDMLLYTTKNQYKYRDCIHFNNTKVLPGDEPLHIVLQTRGRNAVFVARHEADYKEWMSLLETTVATHALLVSQQRAKRKEAAAARRAQLQGIKDKVTPREAALSIADIGSASSSPSTGIKALPRRSSTTVSSGVGSSGGGLYETTDEEVSVSEAKNGGGDDDDDDGGHPLGNGQLVSRPYNVKHNQHVDMNFQWQGENLEKSFRLVQKLGEGSFGEVYRARHPSGFQLAVKLIHLESSPDESDEMKAAREEEIKSIKEEMEILRKCRHKNIVAYYGCYGPDSQNRLWILMDLCEVGSLTDLLEYTHTQMTERQIGYVMASTLKALTYLHKTRNIVHRDVKAGNVLIGKDGTVSLADFGVSKQLKGDPTASGDMNDPDWGQIVGSPLWMSPEVVSGQTPNAKNDIWALGITAIEIADGQPPRSELSVFRVLRAIANQPAPSFGETAVFWSSAFKSFVKACLAKKAEDRPSALELLSHPFIAPYMATDCSHVMRPIIYKFERLKRNRNRNLTIFGSFEIVRGAMFDRSMQKNIELVRKQLAANKRRQQQRMGHFKDAADGNASTAKIQLTAHELSVVSEDDDSAAGTTKVRASVDSVPSLIVLGGDDLDQVAAEPDGGTESANATLKHDVSGAGAAGADDDEDYEPDFDI